MRKAFLKLLSLLSLVFLSTAQQTKKPISNQDILAVLGEQPNPKPGQPEPVPLMTGQGPPAKQPVLPAPTLNVEPLPQRPVTGANVMSSLQAACQSLANFISRSEFVQQQMAMMPPGLMQWLYALKTGFSTECGFSSYSNALNIFATACHVFETCPLPAPVTDLRMMMPGFAAGFEMPLQPRGGLGLPRGSLPTPLQPIPVQSMPMQPLAPVQTLPMQPIPVPPTSVQTVQPLPAQPLPEQPVPIKPRTPSVPVPRLPVISPSRRKVQVQAQQVQLPERPRKSGGQAQQPRVQVITKLAPRPVKAVKPPVAPVSPAKPPVPLPEQPIQTLPRMPVPSMAAMYPLWVYRFRQMPTFGNSVRSRQQLSTPRPRPDHDNSD